VLTSKELTDGEKLFLDRRRLGESQSVAAERVGTSLFNYRRLEKAPELSSGKQPKLGRITKAESCVIYRRRSGMTTQAVADAVGYCRWWVFRMENGQVDPAPLLEYWVT